MASYKTDFLHTLRWTGKFYLFFLEIWPKLRAKLIFQVFLTFFWKEEIYLIRGLRKIQVFSKGGLMKRGPQRRLSRPGKCDFRHPKAKSACFDISFFKVKVSFFLHKNITKLRKNDVNTLYFYLFFNYFFLCFVKDRINKKHCSGVSFHKKLNHRIVVNRLFLVNVHHSQAWQSFRSHGGMVVCLLAHCLLKWLALLSSWGLPWLWIYCV